MKLYYPPSPGGRRAMRRLPCFHPVPVKARADGWTHQRQAAFIGYLAQTGCVATAARLVCMGRESAYRLRRRPGAAGFAAAWDAALGKSHAGVDLTSAKATGLPASYRFAHGLLKVVMERGRLVKIQRKQDDNALLQHLGQCDRARTGGAATG
ncbi:hypothetical protein [Qipengyuania sp. JC766]|uniref:hypothetical protein n=1 Tax=Qipengyuania sp. JC766 TaxID=3232139 RepID=UPI003459D231